MLILFVICARIFKNKKVFKTIRIKFVPMIRVINNIISFSNNKLEIDKKITKIPIES